MNRAADSDAGSERGKPRPAPVVATRQIAFWEPEEGKGKWHAAWMISHVPVCGVAVDLGRANVIRSGVGDRLHPFACKRCARLTVTEGVSAEGVER